MLPFEAWPVKVDQRAALAATPPDGAESPGTLTTPPLVPPSATNPLTLHHHKLTLYMFNLVSAPTHVHLIPISTFHHHYHLHTLSPFTTATNTTSSPFAYPTSYQHPLTFTSFPYPPFTSTNTPHLHYHPSATYPSNPSPPPLLEIAQTHYHFYIPKHHHHHHPLPSTRPPPFTHRSYTLALNKYCSPVLLYKCC